MKLNSPDTLTDAPVGGVVIFSPAPASAAGRMARGKDRHGAGDRLAKALQSAGLAVLRVELPARMSARNMTKARARAVEKRIKSSVESLSAQCGENGHRIAVVAEQAAADVAVLGVRAEWRVRALVLLSGRLSRRAKDVLAAWQDDAVLCLVSAEDKPALRDLTDVYFESKSRDTDIRVFEGLGRGMAMLDSQDGRTSTKEPLERTVADWLHRQLSSVGRAREVWFMSQDGWKIFGNLLLPDPGNGPAPGIVLLHSGRSDRYVFSDFERLLIRSGFAVLNIDWRGRGKSINKGRYFDLSKAERADGRLDAKAAIDFLTWQPGVDKHRVGLVGIVHGAEHAVRGSIGDPRVKALALLTGYVPADDKERVYLTSGKVHVLYVTCEGHRQVTKAMRGLYEASSDKLTRLLLFPGGAIGYQLFELNDALEPTIVEWLKEAMK